MIMTESKSNAKITVDEAKPSFHDFFGRSSSPASPRAAPGDDLPPSISAASDLGSEKQVTNLLEGVPFYGPGAGSEMSNISTGNKRSLSESVFMGSPRDGFQHIQTESGENLHLKKILRNAGAERPMRAHDEVMFFATNPLRTCSTPHLLGSSSSSRTNPNGPKWDRAIPLHLGPRVGQISPLGLHIAPNRFKDGNVGPLGVSQSAADEGSRTGIKGSGILSSISGGMGVSDRVPSGVMLYENRKNSGKPNSKPESSGSASRHGSASGNHQMTIFYGGQAHVFDDVHPDKADVIMALAGSNGGSWSTSYAKSTTPATGESFKLKEADVASKQVPPGKLKRNLSIAGSTARKFGSGNQISVPLVAGGHQGGIIMNAKQGENAGEMEAVQKHGV